MKTRFCIFLAAVLSVFSATARTTITPSGPMMVRGYQAEGFDRIAVSGVMDVELIPGEWRIEVTTYENVLPVVMVTQKDGKLSLRIKDDTDFKGDATIKVRVGMPSLRGVEVSGVCNVHTTGTVTSAGDFKVTLGGVSKFSGAVSAEAIQVSVSGTSKCTADLTASGAAAIRLSGVSSFRGAVDCKELNLNVSGTGSAEITGVCGGFWASCSGVSKARCYGLLCSSLSVHLSGTSVGEFTCSGPSEVSSGAACRINIKKPE